MNVGTGPGSGGPGDNTESGDDYYSDERAIARGIQLAQALSSYDANNSPPNRDDYPPTVAGAGQYRDDRNAWAQ